MLKYLITAIIFVVLDGFYLNLMKTHFNQQIKQIQGSNMNVNLIAAGLTYVLLIFTISYFIIKTNRRPEDAALLGFGIYGTYELTNYALFKDWNLTTVLIDSAWGALLFYLTTTIIQILF